MDDDRDALLLALLKQPLGFVPEGIDVGDIKGRVFVGRRLHSRVFAGLELMFQSTADSAFLDGVLIFEIEQDFHYSASSFFSGLMKLTIGHADEEKGDDWANRRDAEEHMLNREEGGSALGKEIWVHRFGD